MASVPKGGGGGKAAGAEKTLNSVLNSTDRWYVDFLNTKLRTKMKFRLKGHETRLRAVKQSWWLDAGILLQIRGPVGVDLITKPNELPGGTGTIMVRTVMMDIRLSNKDIDWEQVGRT